MRSVTETNQAEPELSDEPKTLRQLLENRVAAAPEKQFLFSEADGRQFTFADFDNAVNRSAALLQSHGVGKGQVVSLLMPNSAEYIVAYFACWKLGATAGPINSLLKAQEISFLLTDSETRLLLAHPEFVPTIESIRTNVPTLSDVIIFDNVAEATHGLDEFTSSDPTIDRE